LQLTTNDGWYIANGMLVLPASAFFLIALIIWVLRTLDPEQQEKK
jgi:Na+-transporting NADH:ubiquinone oxidoreductase subunit D